MEFTTKIKRKAYGEVRADKKVSLFSVLDELSTPIHESVDTVHGRSGTRYGFILSTEQNLADRKTSVNSKSWAEVTGQISLQMRHRWKSVMTGNWKKIGELHLEREGAQFDILMENLGRVNYGPQIENQKKGITKGVWFNWAFQNGWDIYPLPLNNIEQVDFSKEYKEGPAFYHFELIVDETADTFLELPGFGHGCVFINGKNLGRFWEIGPQKRLTFRRRFFEKERMTSLYSRQTGKPVTVSGLGGRTVAVMLSGTEIMEDG